MKPFNLKDYVVAPDNKIAKRVIYHDETIAAFVLNIATGAVLPNHTHFECTVLVLVLAGNGVATTNGKETDIATQDLLQIEGQETLGLQNTGDSTLTVYVTLSPLPPSEAYYVDADI